MRTSSALFVPVTESLILALVCCFLLHAFFSTLVPSDYAAAIRSSLMAALLINISSAAVHAVLATANKTSEIVKYAVAGGEKQEGTWLSYQQALGTANAHCCASFALLLAYVLMFVQITALPGDLTGGEEETYVIGGKSFKGTHLNEWMQAVVGGGIDNGSVIPIAGSIYAGLLMAFLALMFLISIYAVFTALPEETASYIFLEPRFLVLLSGMMTLLSAYSVKNSFLYCYCEQESNCWSTTILCIMFALFSGLICFLDLLLGLVLPQKVYAVCRLSTLIIGAAAPAVAAVIVDQVPNMFRMAAWATSILAVLGSFLEYAFFKTTSKASKKKQRRQKESQNQREDESVASVTGPEEQEHDEGQAEAGKPGEQTKKEEEKDSQKPGTLTMFHQLALPMRDSWIMQNNFHQNPLGNMNNNRFKNQQQQTKPHAA